MTTIYNWKDSIKENELNNCIETLQNGGTVIFPTETVYGIGANAYNENSVKKIYEIKNRPDEKPLSILIGNKSEIEKYAIINNELEAKIINKLMPGPITIVLEKRQGIFDYVSSGKNTIGVRMPDNEIILKILQKLELPIVAPSANISGKPSGVDIVDILKDFDGKVDICIDGGKAKLSEPSTIVQVIDGEPVILRKGKITLEEILKLKNKS